MRRCKRCLMSDTKPGLVLDNEGVCQACRHYEKRSDIDWESRFAELESLVSKYRRTDGSYDSLITVSGGKDSTYQVYVFKKLLGMNPLLVRVSESFEHTEAGRINLETLKDAFSCDIITLDLSPNLVRRMMRIAFEELGSPTWPIDRAIYAFPIQTGIRMGIPLIVYGENVNYEYGGPQTEETYSAKAQIENDVAKRVDFDLWLRNGIERSELNALLYPTKEEVDAAQIEPIYLSYFMPWDGHRNLEVAKRYGFRTLEHEWRREGYIENYDQVDSVGYLMNPWLKYPKFGFARATDVVGYWLRAGRISRSEGARLIREHDHRLDQRVLDDFLRVTGYSDEEFWAIVEKFWNPDLFDKRGGIWTLKDDGLGFVAE